MKIVIEGFDESVVQAYKQANPDHFSKTVKVGFGVIQIARTDPDATGANIQAQMIMNYRGPFSVTTSDSTKVKKTTKKVAKKTTKKVSTKKPKKSPLKKLQDAVFGQDHIISKPKKKVKKATKKVTKKAKEPEVLRRNTNLKGSLPSGFHDDRDPIDEEV